MNLNHPLVKSKVQFWQGKLRSMTEDDSIVLTAVSKAPPKFELEDLIKVVCKATGFSLPEIQKRVRQRKLVVTRQLICYYAYLADLSTADNITSRLGYKNHSSLFHNHQSVCDLIDSKDYLIGFYIEKIEYEMKQYEIITGKKYCFKGGK